MKIRIDRQELFQAFARIQSIVDRRGTLPILSNALIRAGMSSITLSATDLEIGLVSVHPAVVEREGVLTLAAKKLFEIARELEDGEVEISLEEDSRVQLACGEARFSLLSVSPEEYPAVPDDAGIRFVKFESALLGEMIDRTIFAASVDETRYNLNGVFMELTDGDRVSFVATDGHRLARVEKAPSAPMAFLEKGIIVPRKGVAEIRKLCDETEGAVELGVGEGFLLVRRPGLLLSCRLIDGEFPSYRQVVPTDFRIHLLLDRERLTHAMRRVHVVANERSRSFRFAIEKGEMELVASNPGLGEAREVLPVDYSGDRLETGFSSRYVLDALSAIASKEVLWELVDELAPAQIRPADDPDQISVVMPMRL